MRRHMTNSELNKIRKMLTAGVTDMGEIQAVVPIHVDCIKNVAEQYVKSLKAAKKKPGIKVAAKPAVDPIS